ncbi:hypothetical protein [Streptomyces celluloflavus]|uniref:hypothetical protein n=1 Tax=Streptomyces celluloflavus TaxID=58344 RepID=UPI0036945801
MPLFASCTGMLRTASKGARITYTNSCAAGPDVPDPDLPTFPVRSPEWLDPQ